MSCVGRRTPKRYTHQHTMNKKSSDNSKAGGEQVASKLKNIKLGLDVHADSIVVVRILENSGPQPAQTFRPDKFVAWVKTQLPLADAVHSCYEAGPFGYGLHRQLVALGVQNHVIQPVCLDERHKNVNHDKSDARELCLRLDRFVAGNTRALALVRVPTPEQERQRVHSRQREQIKREVQRVAAQGRGLLLSQGHREKRSWWKAARWLDLQSRLEPWLLERLEVFRRTLEFLTGELNQLSAQLVAAAPKILPKGMGALTLQTIENEVGDWHRFENRGQVGSYAGLCGGVSSSGNSQRLLSITKHGNVRLRTALVELAWRMVLWQPQSKRVQGWKDVFFAERKASSAARKKAAVGLARELAVDLWRWRTGVVSPEDLGWIMTERP
jgi:transposase